MPSDAVIARAISNLLDLQRVGNGVNREAAALIDKLFDELVAVIAKNDPTAVVRPVYRKARIAKVLAEVQKLTGARLREVQRIIRSRMADIGVAGGSVAERTLEVVVGDARVIRTGAVSREFMLAILDADPFADDTLAGWFSRLDQLVTTRVRREIQAGMTIGETLDQIVRRVRGTKARRGVLQATKRDAETIVRTGINYVSNRGYLATFQKNADILTGLEFTATLDGRTSDLCIAADGKVLDVTDPDPAYIPPLHPNCVPGDCRVLARFGIAGASKRWFNGDMVVIKTASGRELTCTPNHPVLTDEGWSAAHLVDVGHHVVCDGGSEWRDLVVGNGQNAPASAHEVAEAALRALKVPAVPVPVSAEDFHGDGMDGQVAIVGTDRLLLDRLDAAFQQHVHETTLCIRHVGQVTLTGTGLLAESRERWLGTADGVVGGSGEAGDLFGAGAVHAGLLLLAPVPDVDTEAPEAKDDDVVTHAEFLGDAPGADPLGVPSDDPVFVDVDFPAGPHSIGLDAPVDRVAGYRKLASQIIDGLAGQIFLDDVVGVERDPFRGHVYNLEAGGGFYSANGIITHNCRSVLVPVVDLEDAPEGIRASADGPQAGGTSYEDWFRRQTPQKQNEIIGRGKAELFRAGKISLKDLVTRDRRILTIEQLANGA